MKTLLILRHAKSSWSDESLPDHERPLNGRGRRDAPRMGELLRAQGLTPDRIISSTALRARTTAEAVAEACGFTGDVETTDDLYHAAPADCLRVVGERCADEDRVLIVAHNPGLQELVTRLTGARQEFPTACLAEVSLPLDDWRDLALDATGTLENIWRPKELDA